MFNKNTSSTASNTPAAKKARQIIKEPGKVIAPSILSADLIITGDISSDGDIQIDGRLDGNIKAEILTIGEQGAINGTVKAGSVLVRGKVTGKINATTVNLLETANVTADIVQDQLSIANGAFFDGKCTRKTKPKPAPEPAKTTIRS